MQSSTFRARKANCENHFFDSLILFLDLLSTNSIGKVAGMRKPVIDFISAGFTGRTETCCKTLNCPMKLLLYDHQ